jgi:hypothetical protein
MGHLLGTPLRSPLRWGAAVLLLVTAGTHVPLIRDHLREAPYVGVLFIALVVVSVVLAALIVVRDAPLVWVTSAVVTTLAVVAFVASRTVGLPEIGDDVGNWTEPLGFPAVAAEVLTTLAALAVLRRHAVAGLRRHAAVAVPGRHSPTCDRGDRPSRP